ncbi:UDP-N-acetylglucosamine 2-epimerase (hydrolyzing) [Candidatus Falkowbacteria bacterium CG10_big_fil_rev_8_21_14_0_10_43_10]|uniref:UDP-N-acetylglucosamine 2-epimerase (Hydrolyzing) n=1 Tax=Candidatus Falkowbacteria bacterium CG10_big_fil_rev_8_21_14_0_10_43_10 TaxID=1974567 RepID=A0A2H0V249_9BACT|nr:MAG: UDP-N-acetylglucosamine 2-epimerase (hydrolyzing) [Candidatus Falkowbacteria bacterium CG10_big_fil_rev_8_21_14_0_10_43_10]
MPKNKKIILVVTGTRAEYGLLESTIKEIMKSKKLELRLLVTGMHTLKRYGLTINEIKKDKLPITKVVKIKERSDMLDALAQEIIGIKKYCEKNRPDLILVLGDRDEPFAAAITGGHLGIPVGHIHGGDVSGAVVDDYIRHAITKFSHLHFTASKYSRQRVLKLGEEKWRVFNVGAPGWDNLKEEKYLNRQELADKFKLDKNKKWFLVLQHPAPLENISVIRQITPTLKAIARHDAEKIIIYPNSDTGSDIIARTINNYRGRKNYHINKSLERKVYLSFLKHGDLLIGNSSSGIIESGFFKLPTVNIGNRQSGRETGRNVIHAGYEEKGITRAISRALSADFRENIKMENNIYGSGAAGKKIVKILERVAYDHKLLAKKFTYAKIK